MIEEKDVNYYIVNCLNNLIINPLSIIEGNLCKISLNAACLLEKCADAKSTYLMAQGYYLNVSFYIGILNTDVDGIKPKVSVCQEKRYGKSGWPG